MTDTDLGTAETPGGRVLFTSNKSGTFKPYTCVPTGAGASAGCEVEYTPLAAANGEHTVTATYQPDATHVSSSDQTLVAVSARATTTSVTCLQSTLSVGETTTCAATVTDTSGGPAITPTGSVSFSGHGGDSFTGSPCTLSGSDGTAGCQVSYAATAVGTGSHTLAAAYGGDSAHRPSRGQTSVTVTAAPG